MSLSEISCDLVDEDDLDTRYLAGRLSQREAETFEGHFFACERCWGLVQQGLAVRSAFGTEAIAPQLPAASASKPTRGRWLGLAAAAVIVVAAAGLWRLAYTPETNSAEDVFRGNTKPLAVAAAADQTGLAAAWQRLPDADVYRVRLFGADGTIVLERETADTSISVPLDSLSVTRGVQLFWQVQALDRLRQPIMVSDLTGTLLPPPAP